jgi:hypothetical protein
MEVLIFVGYTWLELFPRTGRKHQVIILNWIHLKTHHDDTKTLNFFPLMFSS